MIKHRDTYKYCTYCTAKLRIEQDYKVCLDCGKHYYFNSKPTVAAVLTNRHDEILLVKRARDPFKGWWDLPGGFVDEDETLEQATLREIREETGISVEGLRYVGSFYDDYHFRNEIVSVVTAVFVGSVADNTVVTVGDDASDYGFFPKKELDTDLVAFNNQRKFLHDLISG